MLLPNKSCTSTTRPPPSRQLRRAFQLTNARLGLARVLDVQVVEQGPHLQDLLGLDRDVAGLTLGGGAWARAALPGELWNGEGWGRTRRHGPMPGAKFCARPMLLCHDSRPKFMDA